MNFLSRRIDLHFIDSPEPEARAAGFLESERIISGLRLPTARIFRHECVTRDNLEGTLKKIARLKADYAYPRKALPFIHIAAHGNPDGLVLGEGEMLGWHELLAFLRPIAVRTDYNALLAMSSCHGFYAYRLAYLESAKPYHLAIGPTRKIRWKYLIAGFTEFYNCLLVDGLSLKATASRVNDHIRASAVQLDYTFGWEVQGHYAQVGFDDPTRLTARRKQSARMRRE